MMVKDLMARLFLFCISRATARKPPLKIRLEMLWKRQDYVSRMMISRGKNYVAFFLSQYNNKDVILVGITSSSMPVFQAV